MMSSSAKNPQSIETAIMATGHGERARAARRLQAVFRGWRTRRRVVWDVRAELDAFMDEIEADVEMERLLLTLPKPHVHSWQREHGSGATSSCCTLRLPRIEDNVFGRRLAFPEPARSQGEVANCIAMQDSSAVEKMPSKGQAVEVAAPSTGSLPVSQSVKDVVEPSEDVHVVGEDPLAQLLQPGGCVEAEQQEAIASLEKDPETASAASSAEKHEEEAASLIAPVSVKVQSTGSAEREPISGSPLIFGEIHAPHSREEILLELQWARQALRERVHYLRSRNGGSTGSR
jgi:hypothetical protein